MDMGTVVEKIGSFGPLDRVAEPLADKAHEVITPEAKHVLSGAWLGHPLHPLLTDLPIGAWTSAILLDMIPGPSARRAARVLVGAGILATLPTAAAGLSDWSDLTGEDRRVGLIHAAANTVALAFFTKSFLTRLRGKRRGRFSALMGAAAMSAGGYLGGHLSYRRGVGVDHNVFDTAADDQWTSVAEFAALPDGEPEVVTVNGTEVMVLRRGRDVVAIGNRCSHLGGPLDRGELGVTTVTCPWHGSTFELADGSVVRGPATAPQPCFETRVTGGKVEIRRRSARVHHHNGHVGVGAAFA